MVSFELVCSVVNVLTIFLQLLSEWDIDADTTPAAIADRKFAMSKDERKFATTKEKRKVPLVMPSQKRDAKKQMLMYGHVELPEQNFSFKKESGEPQCEEGCAFQDKVFTVEVSAIRNKQSVY